MIDAYARLVVVKRGFTCYKEEKPYLINILITAVLKFNRGNWRKKLLTYFFGQVRHPPS